MSLNEDAVIRYITDTFAGIEIVAAEGSTYIFHGPDRKLPLATVVTNDDHDLFSNLNRPSVFRLNIGISKATYLSLFGSPPTGPIGAAVFDKNYDFTALDQLLPHPVYGQMFWVCVLNPSDATFQQTVRPLLAEAYALAVRRHT